MTTDLERRIRESLDVRAADVEPTPALWDRVQARSRRNRRRTAALWVAGAAAAATVAVVVVPQLVPGGGTAPDVMIDTEPPVQPTPTPTAPPEDATPAQDAVAPTHLVVAETQAVRLHTLTGTEVATLIDWGATGESEARIDRVAVRPGSTPDDLDVIVASASEGEWSLWHIARRQGGEAQVERYAVASDVPPPAGFTPDPVWSEDGSLLAYRLAEGDGVSLAVQAWDGSPSSPTQVLVDGLDRLRLRDWSGGEDGTIAASSDGGAVVIDVRDGTVVPHAVPAGVAAAPSELVAIVDALGSTPPIRGYVLARGDDGYALWWYGAEETAGDVGAPPALDAPADEVWIGAAGDIVTVGDRSRAWVLDARAQATLAEFSGVTAADVVPLSRPDGAMPAPTEPDDRAPTAEGAYLWIDRDAGQLVQVDADGPTDRVLHRWTPGAEFAPVEVAIRPGSTRDELTAVLLTAGEGETELGWVDVRDGDVTYRPFPDAYQMAPGLDGPSVAVPVFSSDGQYLAWIEEPGATGNPGTPSGTFTLRIVGWLDGPGTGDPATDNASFDLPLAAAGIDDAVVDEWTLGAGAGLVTLRVDTADGPDVRHVTVERQPDGAITVPTGEPLVLDARTATWIDQAEHPDGRFHLAVDPVGATLAIVTPAGTRPLALPAGFDTDLARVLPPAGRSLLLPHPAGALLRSPDGRGAWVVTVEDVDPLPPWVGAAWAIP